MCPPIRVCNYLRCNLGELEINTHGIPTTTFCKQGTVLASQLYGIKVIYYKYLGRMELIPTSVGTLLATRTMRLISLDKIFETQSRVDPRGGSHLTILGSPRGGF